jgi:hypothetical protein
MDFLNESPKYKETYNKAKSLILNEQKNIKN